MATDNRSFRHSYHNKEALLAQANARTGGYDDFIKSNVKKYKVRDGKNVVRILPATWKDADHYAYKVWLNYKIGPDNATYLSLSKMGKGRDPIVEAQRVAERNDDEEQVKALRASSRLLMWVIDRQAPEEGVLLWSCPITVGKNLATLAIDEDTGGVSYIDHEEEGQDFRFHKEGTGLNTDYDPLKMKLLAPSPLSDDPAETKEWLAFTEAHPIPSTLNFYSYEYISQVFNGTPVTPKGNGKVDHNEPDELPVAPPARRREGDDGEPARVAQRVPVPEEAAPRRSSPRIVEDSDLPEGGSIRDRIRARQSAAVVVDDD
jgi:hypothetical protein